MLETIREYAQERLEESGETEGARQRHLDFFLELAEQGNPGLQRGSHEAQWLDRWRASTTISARRSTGAVPPPVAEAGLRIVTALWELWFSHGHFLEGSCWMTAFLEADAGAPVRIRGRALLKAGYANSNLCELVRATAFFGEGLALYRALDDDANVADALRGLGRVADAQGEHEAAVDLLEESLALSRSADDLNGSSWSLIFLGTAIHHTGAFNRAEAVLQEGVASARSLGRESVLARGLMRLGSAAHALGDHERAVALSEQAVAMSRPLGSRLIWGDALCTLGWIAVHQHDLERACARFTESLALNRGSGAAQVVATALEGWSAVAVGLGRTADAVRCLGAIAAFREATGALLPRPEQARHDQTLLAARGALSEAAFAAEWSAGRMMSLDQATACALDVSGPA